MKTQTNNNWHRRNYMKIFLAIQIMFLTLAFTSEGFAQDISQRISNTESLFEQMKVYKADTNYTHKWNEDSSRWELYNREISLYKEKNQLVGTLNERWEEEDLDWENYDRTVRSYDERGKMIENLHQQWSPERSKWMNLQLKTFTYDRLGNKSEILYHEWQQAVGQWFSTVRYLIDYNINGEESEVLIKVYSPATDSWSNDTRYSFIYDDGYGSPDKALVESWNGFDQEWENRGMYDMAYNFRGKKVKESRATWNESMRKWINGIRYLMDYDKKLLTTEIEQRWDFRSSEWNNAIRNLFSYDKQGEIKEMVEERWDREQDSWVTKNIYLYSDLKDLQDTTQKPEKKE
ncbi:MAG: hypothetical protein KGY60_09740 [Bacteroidales bacterium]|nr:hypothetical protein [Bacteroidales bacterium]